MNRFARRLHLIAAAAICAVGIAVSGGDRFALAQALPDREPLRDCPGCPELVAVAPGAYRMGMAEDLSEAPRPQHPVSIGYAFAAGKHEVTRGQFAEFIRESGYAASAARNCSVLNTRDLQWSDQDDARSWRDPGFEQDDDHPVVCVSWIDAKAYAGWLSKKTGRKYRLLSEAEWEYAARAGANRARRPWGDDSKDACRFANVWDEAYQKEKGLPRQLPRGFQPAFSKGESSLRGETVNPLNNPRAGPWYLAAHWCNDAFAFTSRAGQFAANGFGLHDMIGNVMEWVEDCLHLNYHGAPADGSAWTQDNCTHRVMRGGSWASIPEDAQSGKRFFRLQEYRASDLGFRVARPL